MVKLTKKQREKLRKDFKINVENLSDEQLIKRAREKTEKKFIKKIEKMMKKEIRKTIKKLIRTIEKDKIK